MKNRKKIKNKNRNAFKSFYSTYYAFRKSFVLGEIVKMALNSNERGHLE